MHKLYRSRDERVLGGVCGGFGEYWGIDPVILRLLFIFLTIVTAVFPMLLIYLIAWAIMPRAPEGYVSYLPARLYRSREDRRIAGVCGGIAHFFEVDSTLVRLGVVLLCVLTAIVPLLLSYLIGWMVIPLSKQSA